MDLAETANLEITPEEAEAWTPKVHGVLRWMAKLNDVDLDTLRTDVELYRDSWRMPLREDEPVDFANREAMFAECKTWEKPFVKVPKVDKKEAAAEAKETTTDSAPSPDAVSYTHLTLPTICSV